MPMNQSSGHVRESATTGSRAQIISSGAGVGADTVVALVAHIGGSCAQAADQPSHPAWSGYRR